MFHAPIAEVFRQAALISSGDDCFKESCAARSGGGGEEATKLMLCSGCRIAKYCCQGASKEVMVGVAQKVMSSNARPL